MNVRSGPVRLLLVAALAGGWGCGKGTTGKASALPGTAPARTALRLAVPEKVNFESFLVARERGYFQAEGLDVTFVRVTGGIEAAEALATGNADAAACGDVPAILLMSRGAPIRILARYASGERIHRLVGRKAGPGLPVAGSRIGMQFGSSTSAGLSLWLAAQGIAESSVILVPLSPPDMPAAIAGESVEFIASSEPVPTKILANDAFTEVGVFSGLGVTYPHLLLATEALAGDEAVTARILRALQRAIDDIHRQPDRCGGVTGPLIGLAPDLATRCTERLTWEIGWTPDDARSLEVLARHLLAVGKIARLPEIERFVHGR